MMFYNTIGFIDTCPCPTKAASKAQAEAEFFSYLRKTFATKAEIIAP
jgi:hypothetical protein